MSKKFMILVAINLATLIALLMQPPIAQNPAYHNFVDTRNFFGIPNFCDCFSNIFFLFVAAIGLRYSAKEYLSLSWKLFFISVGLVAFGSFYYHYNPTNSTLVWDRLPMTLAFMSLVNAVFFETFKLKGERLSLLVLNLLGISSIIVWVLTDDLRFYYWIQLTPILSLLIIGLFMSKKLNPKFMLLAFVMYMLAKYTELNDSKFYKAIGVSGHTIKHILAAIAVYFLYLMKKKEKEH